MIQLHLCGKCLCWHWEGKTICKLAGNLPFYIIFGIMQKLIKHIVLPSIVLLLVISSCAHRSYGGHRPGGNLTKNYHDGHLGR